MKYKVFNTTGEFEKWQENLKATIKIGIISPVAVSSISTKYNVNNSNTEKYIPTYGIMVTYVETGE